jgi:DNA-binding MarR family transcriptional regulator
VTTEPDEDITGRLYLAIGRLSRALRQSGTPGPGQGAISALATLAHFGQMRLGDLAAREGVAAATMSRIVAALVEMGYVRREADSADRRAWLATLTEEGATLVSGVRSTRMAELGRRIDKLSAADRAILVDALPVLEALLIEQSDEDS